MKDLGFVFEEGEEPSEEELWMFGFNGSEYYTSPLFFFENQEKAKIKLEESFDTLVAHPSLGLPFNVFYSEHEREIYALGFILESISKQEMLKLKKQIIVDFKTSYVDVTNLTL